LALRPADADYARGRAEVHLIEANILVSITLMANGAAVTSSMGTLRSAAGGMTAVHQQGDRPGTATVSSEMSPNTALTTTTRRRRRKPKGPRSVPQPQPAAAARAAPARRGCGRPAQHGADRPRQRRRPPGAGFGGRVIRSAAPDHRSTPLAATVSATGRGPATTAATCPSAPAARRGRARPRSGCDRRLITDDDPGVHAHCRVLSLVPPASTVPATVLAARCWPSQGPAPCSA